MPGTDYDSAKNVHICRNGVPGRASGHVPGRSAAHSGQTGRACAVPPKLSLNSLKLSKIFAFKPKVKTVAEKLSFKLHI